ncbi:MAG: lactate/malate family dehydrogenase [Gammaproteobacteria bacterium]
MKISIIGLGRVGSTLAYTVMIKELCDELILVNRNPEVAIGDAKDLQHALPFIERQMIIDAGGIPETADSDIVVMCASGRTPKNMRSRLEPRAFVRVEDIDDKRGDSRCCGADHGEARG